MLGLRPETVPREALSVRDWDNVLATSSGGEGFRTAVGTIASQNVARGVFAPDEYVNPPPSLERELGGRRRLHGRSDRSTVQHFFACFAGVRRRCPFLHRSVSRDSRTDTPGRLTAGEDV